MSLDGVKGCSRTFDQQGFHRASNALRKLSLVESNAANTMSDKEDRRPALSNLESRKPVDIGGVPIRKEKVLEARQRILDGYYDRAEVRETLIRNLLENFGMDEQD